MLESKNKFFTFCCSKFPQNKLKIDCQQGIFNAIYLVSGDMSSYTNFAYMGGISAMLNDLVGLLNALPARTLFHLVSHSSYFLAEIPNYYF